MSKRGLNILAHRWTIYTYTKFKNLKLIELMELTLTCKNTNEQGNLKSQPTVSKSFGAGDESIVKFL